LLAPTLPAFEAPPPQRPERSSGLDIAWKILCWFIALLWAMLKLPWRGLRAIRGWYGGLDDELAANLRLFVFTLMLIAGGVALVLHPPGWLAGLVPAMPSLTRDAEPNAPTWPPAEAAPQAPTCPTVRVTAARLNLRAEPGLQGQIVRKLQRDERLTVLNCAGHELDGYTWWQVVGDDGHAGWVATQWLER
jgi:hypothetical protein